MQRIYEPIDFPPLTEEQKAEIEYLKNMSDDEIDYSDAPKCDFTNGYSYYIQPNKDLDEENQRWLESDGNNYRTKLNAVVSWARLHGCPIHQIG